MKVDERLKKVEAALSLGIPEAEKYVVVWPNGTDAAEKEKITHHYESLREKYGDTVKREDVGVIRVVYDSCPPHHGE